MDSTDGLNEFEKELQKKVFELFTLSPTKIKHYNAVIKKNMKKNKAKFMADYPFMDKDTHIISFRDGVNVPASNDFIKHVKMLQRVKNYYKFDLLS